MNENEKFPCCISGSITEAGLSHCSDGATHLSHGPTGTVRLVPNNDGVKTKLDQYVDAKVIVTTCGHWVCGPECCHINVCTVTLGTEFSKKLHML